MRLLANPIVLRMIVMLMASAFMFLVAVIMMRGMRRSLNAEASWTPDTPTTENLPLHTYHAVIQQLKQQKHELQSEQQVERRRAKTSESINAAVLSNVSSGVLFFTPDGLVRQANSAAKRILGHASPVGNRAAQIFRDAAVLPVSGGQGSNLAESIQHSLQEITGFSRLRAQYKTPAGEERTLEVTLTAVLAQTGEALGAACLIDDDSEIAQLRRQQEWLDEISSEMALDLHTSLNTISGYAQQMASSRDPELTRRLADDIAVEAAQMEHTIGGFLAGATTASAAPVTKYVSTLQMPARRTAEQETEQI